MEWRTFGSLEEGKDKGLTDFGGENRGKIAEISIERQKVLPKHVDPTRSTFGELTCSLTWDLLDLPSAVGLCLEVPRNASCLPRPVGYHTVRVGFCRAVVFLLFGTFVPLSSPVSLGHSFPTKKSSHRN